MSEAKPKKSVLIVDDHPMFRAGLRNIIDRSADYELIGEAGSGQEAIDFIKQNRCDLITMDLSLPDLNGMDVIGRIRDLVPHIPILVVSMHSDFGYIQESLQAGAKGYIAKEATGDKLVQAMDTITHNDYYLDGFASQEVISNLLTRESKSKEADLYDLLTPREQEIFRLTAEGLSNQEIAGQLSITPKTVDNHRTNLMKKLDVHSKLELVRYAVKIGLIDMESWK